MPSIDVDLVASTSRCHHVHSSSLPTLDCYWCHGASTNMMAVYDHHITTVMSHVMPLTISTAFVSPVYGADMMFHIDAIGYVMSLSGPSRL